MVTKWLSSYRTYSLAVLYTHILIFTFFFPTLVFNILFIVAVFCLAFAWGDLINKIEQSNRDHLLFLINTSTNEYTKDVLRYELYMHDKHSIYGENHWGGTYVL